jgi:excisionase family DNA binding protein
LGKVPENKSTVYMSPKEVAGLYGVCTKTVLRWIRDKKIHTVQITDGGRRFIQEKDLPK